VPLPPCPTHCSGNPKADGGDSTARRGRVPTRRVRLASMCQLGIVSAGHRVGARGGRRGRFATHTTHAEMLLQLMNIIISSSRR